MGQAKRNRDAGIESWKRTVEVTGIQRFVASKVANALPTKGDGTQRVELIRQLRGDDPEWSWDKLGRKDFDPERMDDVHKLEFAKGTLEYFERFLKEVDESGAVPGAQFVHLVDLAAKFRTALAEPPAPPA